MKSVVKMIKLIVSLTMVLIFSQSINAQQNKQDDEVDTIVRSILFVRDTPADSSSLSFQKGIQELAESGINIQDVAEASDSIGDADQGFILRWENAVSLSDSISAEGEGKLHDSDHRGGKSAPRVTTRRHYLKKGETNINLIRSSERLSVAVVPEKDGLVTMRLHAYNRHGYEKFFDDTEKFHQGKSYRKRVLTLPKEVTKVEVEIINRSPKDISYILITK